MALLRLIYRRFNLVAAILVITSLWVLYLIISAPAASDQKYVNSVMPYVDMDKYAKPSVTRKVTAGLGDDQEYLDKVVDNIKIRNNLLPPPPPDENIEKKTDQVNDKPSIPKPPDIDAEIKDNQGAVDHEAMEFKSDKKVEPDVKEEQKDNSAKVDENKANIEKDKVKLDDSKAKIDEDKVKLDETKAADKVNDLSKNDTKVSKIEDTAKNTTKSDLKNQTKGPVLKVVEKKVYEIGEKVKNKTIGEWESVKNKTLEKLTNLGVIQKPKYIKLIYRPVKWYLNISLETIGNIMKDTEFLNKKQNLTEMEYQPLLAPNSTLRININSSYGLGFCDCEEFSCVCCVRMFNKWMKLNSTACSKITFESKSQELNFEYSVDKIPVFSEKIAAEFPPKICMESTSKAVGTCVLFANVTSKVAIDNEDHKLHLSGGVSSKDMYGVHIKGSGYLRFIRQRHVKSSNRQRRSQATFVRVYGIRFDTVQ